MIFLPTFNTNFIFPAVEFSVAKFQTFTTLTRFGINCDTATTVTQPLIYFGKVQL